MRIVRQENVFRKHRSKGLALDQSLGERAFPVQSVRPGLALIRIAAERETDLTCEIAQLILGFAKITPASIGVERA